MIKKPMRKNRWTLVLMTGSLLLLLFFLIFWLNNVYQKQKEVLLKETNHLFSSAFRDVEDSLFQKHFLEPILWKFGDQLPFKKLVLPAFKNDTSTRSITVASNIIQRSSTDSLVRMTVKTHKEIDGPGHSPGKFSMMALLAESELQIDSTFSPEKSDSMIIALLDSKLQTAFDTNEIPIAFSVALLDTFAQNNQLLFSDKKINELSGNQLRVQYSSYKSYLLQNMVPHILFSLFLYSCIALAFFLIYRSLREQQRLTQLKNDFISNITHELKTPITTVGVAIEALSNFNALQDPRRTQEYLDISKNELQRLSILVDKVLKMSLFEQAEPELKFEAIDLKILIDEIQNSMKLQFEKLTAQFDFILKGNHFLVRGDRIHLTSVIYNLLDNALKYSRAHPKISIELEHQEQQICMSIRDQGLGIANEYQDKIFDKFFRIPAGDTHDVKGHGLGLSYVASVIKKHEGSINLNSQPGQGSCFIIHLPSYE